MLFNSYIFIFLFLPISLLGYFFLNKFKKYNLAEYFLIIMSLWFYGYFNYKYLFIIIFSIFINYFLGKYMQKAKNKKFFLLLGIFANIGLLFYFKYMNFFVDNLNFLFQTNFEIKKVLLPLGISFFTFQQLSFIVDNYKGNIKSYTFRQYALFVVFFPQLIAGPIVMHNETIPQFEDETKKKFCFENFSKGIMAFSFGLAKKVLIADSLGRVVNYGFSHIMSLGSINAIFVMLSFTLQIYFDFSGYCDMATGIAKMFNIDLPMNFNSPYKSLSVTEFWQRWHITLSRFLKTYIYIPLGGNRKGNARTYINLCIVFLISGLWHGANYTFIIWGCMHGLMLVIERIFKKKICNINIVLRWIVTFAFVNIAWIIFRADTINDAVLFLKQILSFHFIPLNIEMIQCFDFSILPFIFNRIGRLGSYLLNSYPIYVINSIVVMVLLCKNTNERLENFKPNFINSIITSLLLFLSIWSLTSVSNFLYFNF